jgi:hypothetical protein
MGAQKQMKDKIKQEIMELYGNQEIPSNENVGDFVDLAIDKTMDAIFDELRKELKNEFMNGNLKHNFIISSDYYLDLKFKEIKERFGKPPDADIPGEPSE